ncbi:hypothetical protein QTI27_33605 [Variovorax sp. J31P216]|nr:hypothetical protein [Variovorax sp. J31P216]
MQLVPRLRVSETPALQSWLKSARFTAMANANHCQSLRHAIGFHHLIKLHRSK